MPVDDSMKPDSHALSLEPSSTDRTLQPVTDAASNNHISHSARTADVIDIRRSDGIESLAESIQQGLNPAPGVEKTLPTLLLYDEAGLKLFEDITYLDQYYLTNAEIEVLETHADKIADAVKSGTIVVELGSGNLRKVNILLRALEKQHKLVDYYALDLSLPELERTLAQVPANEYQHVRCHGLWGTYDDGLAWLQDPKNALRSKVVVSMGSSIGNFERDSAAGFLKGFAEVLSEDDAMLIGIDACTDPRRVHEAYNDGQGVTHRFTMNGLKHANSILGNETFDLDIWEAIGLYDTVGSRHQAFVFPSRDVAIFGTQIKAGEHIRIEESYKYSTQHRAALFDDSGFDERQRWSNDRGDYSMHLLAKRVYSLPGNPKEYAPTPVPSWEEWQQLWQLWDTVTREMISDEELMDKPIKLRNACIFYLGHIPTFFDIKLAETTDGTFTEPTYFPKIFERGIDPDVDNPEHCHAHSEVPDTWPALDEILMHQRRVRERVQKLYDNGETKNSKVARCLWLGYEHEAMHLETLLYMLIQSEKTQQPPGVPQPAFKLLAEQNARSAVPNEWFDIPAQKVSYGLEDPETDVGPTRYFGWDVEKPPRKANTHAFQAKARPITNEDYAQYILHTGGINPPASWVETVSTTGHSNGTSAANGSSTTEGKSTTNGVSKIKCDLNGHVTHSAVASAFLQGKGVRTVYGAVPLEYALAWPVSASYDELVGCAAYMGGRIPSLEEAHAIYANADRMQTEKEKAAAQALGKTIPAVNSHLVNDGVRETPPANGHVNGTSATNGVHGVNGVEADQGELDPSQVFVDLKGKNVGFHQWTPSSVVDKGQELQGHAGMGGLWEWTSSPLAKHDGFEPMKLYEAYSQDFFDGKHNIVLGGSWATVPRIAGRKSFINWYQRGYPYVWAGARVVRDV